MLDFSLELGVLKSIFQEIDTIILHSTLLLGFLGSGKTTFANQFINNRKNLNFSAIVVETQFPQGVMYEDLLELSDNLISAVSYRHGTPNYISDTIYKIQTNYYTDGKKVDHLLVELSHFSNPEPKANELINLTHLDTIVSVIDSSNIEINLLDSRTTVEGESAHLQIKYSDIILLNKNDLTDENRLELLESKIRQINEKARILRCNYGQVPLPLVSRWGLKYIDDYYHYLEDATVSLVAFESESSFELKKFNDFLDSKLTPNIFRAIGILWFQEIPMRNIFDLAGLRFTLNQDEWKHKPNNQIVLIGQNLETKLLRSQLQECLSSN
ncbi:MAG: CobW family GTP-binding protein [Nostoc sp.]